MLRQFLQNLQGVDVYGILSTLIFFVFFSIVAYQAMKIKKEDDRKYCRFPLDDEDQDIQNDQDNKKN